MSSVIRWDSRGQRMTPFIWDAGAQALQKSLEAHGCSVKKVFLEMLKNWHKTSVPESFFNKVGGVRLKLYLKRDSCTCFLVNLVKFFKTPFCYRAAPVAASESISLDIWKVRKIQCYDHIVSNYVSNSISVLRSEKPLCNLKCKYRVVTAFSKIISLTFVWIFLFFLWSKTCPPYIFFTKEYMILPN